MGAKTEFKKLPALFEERRKLIAHIEGLNVTVKKTSESSGTKASGLRDVFQEGKLTFEAFGKALLALDNNRARQIEDLKKDLDSTESKLRAHEAEIADIMGWIGRRMAERTPDVLKKKMVECDGKIKSLSQKLQAQKQPQAAIDANPDLLALKVKYEKYKDFTKTVMPKYAAMAQQIKDYQALLHGR